MNNQFIRKIVGEGAIAVLGVIVSLNLCVLDKSFDLIILELKIQTWNIILDK